MNYFLRSRRPGEDQTWTIVPGTNAVGRDPVNQIHVLDDSVSRRHAEIEFENGRLQIRDLGSSNGTLLNGTPVTGSLVSLRSGDRLQLGTFELDVVGERSIDEIEADHASEVARGVPAPNGSATSGSDAAAGVEDWLEATETRLGWGEIQKHLDEHAREIMKLYRVLLDAGRMLILPEGLGELFETTVELASRVANADRILVYLLENEVLILKASRGLPEAAAPETLMSRAILRTVLEDQAALLVRDPLSDPRFQASESIRLLRTRSSMTVPLFDNERVIGLLHVDTTNPLNRYDEDQLRALALLGNLIAIKVKNSQLLDELRAKARMDQEMETAAQIQRRLLPERLPDVDGYDLAAHFEPALLTAGDFYDACRCQDGRIEILIGDVAGKGMGAALLMSHTVSAYRVLSGEGHALHELVTRLNEHVFASSDPTRYATLFAARLDPVIHRLEYVNAGHCPPLLLRADGEWERLDATGPAVGLLDKMVFKRGELDIPPGSILCLYTDGVIEAELDTVSAPGADVPGEPDPTSGDQSRELIPFFGEEGLRRALQTAGADAEQVVSSILSEVRSFAVTLQDDCTVVVLRRGMDRTAT